MAIVFSAPSIAAQNTTWTNNLGADGYTWSNANQVVIDQYGCIIISLEDNGGNHKFIFSNDNGVTWLENTGLTDNAHTGSAEPLLGRRAVALDTTNNILHTLNACTNASDGALYRRYIITRDVNHHIVKLDRDYNINFLLEYQSGISAHNVESPVICWLNDASYGAYGAIVCFWAITDGATCEVHASMRVLDNTANDQNATFWRRLDGGTTSTGVAVVSNDNVPVTVVASSGRLYQVAVLRKRANTHINDLYIYYHESSTLGSLYFVRYPWQNATSNWGAPIAPVLIGPTSRAGTNAGSPQQYQVLSRATENVARDRVYIGYENWKSDTAGDTFSFAYINSTDAPSTPVDVYSCSGRFTPNLYALTFQIGWDAVSNALFCAYNHSGGVGFNSGNIRAYKDDDTPASTEFTFIGTQDVDIPDFWQDPASGNTRLSSNPNAIFFAFRNTKNQTPPYTGYSGTVTVTGTASTLTTYTDTIGTSSLTIRTSNKTIATSALAQKTTFLPILLATITKGTFFASAATSTLAAGHLVVNASVTSMATGTFSVRVGVSALAGNVSIVATPTSTIARLTARNVFPVSGLTTFPSRTTVLGVTTITNLHGSLVAHGIQGNMLASVSSPIPAMSAGIRPVLVTRGQVHGG